MGDARPIGGHKVGSGDGAQGEGVVVGAEVAHNADGAVVGEDGKVLVDVAIEAGFGDFVAEDVVGFAQDVEFFFGDLSHYADAESRPGEGLSPHEFGIEAQGLAEFSHFVFEEISEGFDKVLKVDDGGKAPYIVVAFDDGGIARAAFDDVGIDGALGEEVDGADFSAFFFEDADKFFADNFSLLLGVGDALEFFEEAVFGVYVDKVHIAVGEGGFYFFAFVFAHKAMVDEDTGELIADGIGEEFGADGGVDATG